MTGTNDSSDSQKIHRIEPLEAYIPSIFIHLTQSRNLLGFPNRKNEVFSRSSKRKDFNFKRSDSQIILKILDELISKFAKVSGKAVGVETNSSSRFEAISKALYISSCWQRIRILVSQIIEPKP